MFHDDETGLAHDPTTPSTSITSSLASVGAMVPGASGPASDYAKDASDPQQSTEQPMDRHSTSDPGPSGYRGDDLDAASEDGAGPEGTVRVVELLQNGGEQGAPRDKDDDEVAALTDIVDALHVSPVTQDSGDDSPTTSTNVSSSSSVAPSTTPSRSPAHQHHKPHNNSGQKRRDYNNPQQRQSPMIMPYTPPSPYAYPAPLPPPQTYITPGMIPTAPMGAYYPPYYAPAPPPGTMPHYYYDPSAAAASSSYLRPTLRPPPPNVPQTAYALPGYAYPGIPTTPQGTPPIATVSPPLPLPPGTTFPPMNPTTPSAAGRSPRYPHSQLPPPVPGVAQTNFATASIYYDPQQLQQMQGYPSPRLAVYPPRPPHSPSVSAVALPLGPQGQLRPPPVPVPLLNGGGGEMHMMAPYPRPPHSPSQAPAQVPGMPSPALPPRVLGMRPIPAPLTAGGLQAPPHPTPSLSSQMQMRPKNPENAMWVGNLPSNTGPEELRDFFWEDDFESVYHIAKTHCAFVNYRTWDAVLHAVEKFHDKEFKGIRLVCRPRKQTTSASTSAPHPRPTTSTTVSGSLPSLPQPPTPSSSSSSLHSSPRRPSNPTAPPAPEPSSTLSTSSHVADSLSPIRGGQRRTSLRKRSIQDMSVSPQRSPRMLPHPDTTTGAQGAPQPQKRFFILKSLTNDDLDISVKSGVWATQPHNEPGLNRAFKNTETVYLIFSANKSGEFYGFARMTSPIIPNRAADPTASVQWTPVPVDDEDEEDDEDDEDAEQQNGEASQQQHRRQSDSEAEAEATAAAAAAAVTAAATAAAAAAAAAAMAAESEKEEKEKEEKGKEEREHNGERRGSGSGNGNGNMKKDQATKERREKRWGNVFKVEWVKVQRLPFSQTRHLRNPWNNNREVKVSRDGTELETRVGERLLLEFWRAEQAVVGGAVLQGQQPTAQSQQSVGVQPSQQPQPQPQPSPQPPAAQAQMVMGLGLINTPQGLQAVPMPMMQPTVMVGMWGTSPRPGYMAVPPGGMGQGPNNGEYDPTVTPHDPYSQPYPVTTASAGHWPYNAAPAPYPTAAVGQPQYYHPMPPSSPYAYQQGYAYPQQMTQVPVKTGQEGSDGGGEAEGTRSS